MLKLTRLLMLIAVASLAAGPVMACCMTGHAQPAASQETAEVPPCHGERTHSAQDEASLGDEPQLPLECPGCLDCDTAMLQAQSVTEGALLTHIDSGVAAPDLSPRAVTFEPKPFVFKTGPPGDPATALGTPVTLKQRLLI